MTATGPHSERPIHPDEPAAVVANVADIDPYDADLDWLASLAPEEDLPRPHNAQEAERMLRIRQRRLAEVEALNAIFEPQIEMLERRRQDLTAGPLREIAHMVDCLTHYAREHREATNETRLDLPHGRLQTRKGRTSIAIEEDAVDRIIEWAIVHHVEILDHQPESWKVSKKLIAALVKTGTAGFDIRYDLDPESGEILGETPVFIFQVPEDAEGKGASLQIDGISEITGDVGVTIEDAS